LSLPTFLAQFGTEVQCEDALENSRWPQGFHCPECGKSDHYLLKTGKCVGRNSDSVFRRMICD
ncbi:MAG: transposase, partial [Methylococcaceae bacterium]